MRLSSLGLASLTIFTLALAACASSTPGGQPDAEPVDPVDASAPDAGPPDAEPCVPDPDGEQCNGNDDDCDGTTDEGFAGVGEPCSNGVGACSVDGVTQCTEDGSSTECGATPTKPGEELCGSGMDEDCDGQTDEGFPDLGQPCSVGTGACFAAGVFVCSSTGQTTTCNATPGDPLPETCNGMDEDCDTLIDETFSLNQPCDGGDSDLCMEGIYACNGSGGAMCTDTTGSSFDVCNGGDDDCDPTSADGSEDGAVGVMCDGSGDSDLCLDVLSTCAGGSVVCIDNSPSTLDLCGNGNEDCDLASADGSEQAGFGNGCDGSGDSDLCTEGTLVCSGTSLVCNDATGSTTDLCGNGDEDCDPASADGAEHPGIGAACDGGGDSDLCVEGTNVCSGTTLACNDATTSTFEACNGDAVDEDCEGGVDEGFVLNDSPACGTPFYVGAVTGDSGASSITDSWFDEEWDRVRFTENDDGIDYVKGRISLYSPPGVDFDLYVYCVSCGGTLIGSSALGGLTGHTDTVDVSNDDDWPGWDDSFDVIVEIRYWTSNRCAYWTLTATGDTGAETNNCDP
jgi:hypothetical protein